MLMNGRLSDDQRDALKEANPGIDLFKLELEHDDLVYRQLTKTDLIHLRAVYQELQKDGISPDNPYENRPKEAVFNLCVLWPVLNQEEQDRLPIGIIPSVSEAIEVQSGYVGVTVDGFVKGPATRISRVQFGEPWAQLTDQDELNLKEKHKTSLYKVWIDGFTAVIRPQTRADLYVAAQELDDQFALVREVTVWPENLNWEKVPAGYIDIIGNQGNVISGLVDTDKITVTPL